MLRFTLYTFHEFVNLFEDAQRRESWEYFPLELRLHALDAIQFLEVVVLRIPCIFLPKLRLGQRASSFTDHRMQTVDISPTDSFSSSLN